jgi:hypothetical protein
VIGRGTGSSGLVAAEVPGSSNSGSHLECPEAGCVSAPCGFTSTGKRFPIPWIHQSSVLYRLPWPLPSTMIAAREVKQYRSQSSPRYRCTTPSLSGAAKALSIEEQRNYMVSTSTGIGPSRPRARERCWWRPLPHR